MSRKEKMTDGLREKAVAHAEKVLSGEVHGEAWDSDFSRYEGICGWGGVMSPLNRKAFVEVYGEAETAKVEELAKARMAARSAWWANSKAHGYEAQADNAEGNDPAAYEVGMFVWGIGTGLKFDHENLKRAMEEMIDFKPRISGLCRIVRIEETEDIERDMAVLFRDWKPQGEEGGMASDDVTDEEFGKYGENYSRLTKEQQRSFYTYVVLVRDGKGRFVLIDPEGYDYPRYVLFPKNWRQMYAATVESIVNPKPPPEESGKEKAETVAETESKDNGDPAKGEAYWKENRAKKGIEIRFPEKPEAFFIQRLKDNRWRWSRYAGCWYNRMDEGTWETARDIVATYNAGRSAVA